MPDADGDRVGLLLSIAAYVMWGLVTIFWKHLNGFDAFELIGYRITSSAILMFVVVAVSGRLRPLLRDLRDVRLSMRVLLAAVLLTINWSAYVWAVVHGRVMETALGYFFAPIGLTLAGVFVLRERLRGAQRAALALAVAAVVVLTVGYGRAPVLALVIAASWVSYAFIKKQMPLSGIESLTAETLMLFVPAAVMVAVSATRTGSVPDTATGGDWTLVALTGVITTAPLLLFAFAARRITLTTMALVQYIVPTTNFLLGWLAYHEPLSTARVIGFALVWLGVAAVTIDTVRRMRRSLPRRA